MAKKHGANPKDIADQVEASELTLVQIWDAYWDHLRGRKGRTSRTAW